MTRNPNQPYSPPPPPARLPRRLQHPHTYLAWPCIGLCAVCNNVSVSACLFLPIPVLTIRIQYYCLLRYCPVPIECLECLLPTDAYCLLPTAYCLLPTAYCLLPTAYCLLPTAYCLYCLLPTAYTAYCLLPTAYCLLPTAYRLLPTRTILLPIRLPTAYRICRLLPTAYYCELPAILVLRAASCELPTAYCLLLPILPAAC